PHVAAAVDREAAVEAAGQEVGGQALARATGVEAQAGRAADGVVGEHDPSPRLVRVRLGRRSGRRLVEGVLERELGGTAGAAGAGAGVTGGGAVGAVWAEAEGRGAAGRGGRERCSTMRVTITRRTRICRGAAGAAASTCGLGAPSAGSAPRRIWNASRAVIAK